MTENKRFYFDKDGAIMDKEYEFSILGEDELLDIINGLAEENEQLKQENKKLADALTVYFQSKIKGDVE